MPVPTRSGSQSKSLWPSHDPLPSGLAMSSGTHHSDLSSFNIDGEPPNSFYPAAASVLPHTSRTGYDQRQTFYIPIADMDTSLHGSRENVAHLKGLLAILGTRPSHYENLLRPDIPYSPVVHNPNRVFASSYIRTSSTWDHADPPETYHLWRKSVDYGNEQPSPSMRHCTTCVDPPRELLSDAAVDVTPNVDLAAAFTTEPEVFAPLCEPFSFWIADYVWRVVTTGMSLTPECFGPALTTQDPQSLLPLLAESISSLLLSTLLQPSAVFLSLHYISRLPAYIGPCALDADSQSTKSQFRKALASADTTSHDCPVTRTLYACFKLFVVGAILSNKVLDDHVFTLKTWHEISGLPLEALNRLEWLSLDILHHELFVHPVHWNHWLHNLRSYHLSFVSPGLIPPSASTLVRGVLEGLIASQTVLQRTHHSNDPVFLGIADRMKAKVSQTGLTDGGEFDMDEDGPLREEYIPRRTTRSRRPHSISKPWTSPMLDERKSAWSVTSVHTTTPWLITPPDAIPSAMWPVPVPFGVTSREVDVHDWPTSYSSHDLVNAEDTDPAKPTTLRDYFLTCSRTQDNFNSTWISQLA